MSFINNVKTELNASATSSATSIQVVKSVSPYNDPPASGNITLMDSLSSPTKIEIIAYTGRTDNTTYWTLTGCTRAAESTTASTWAAGDNAIQAFTAGDATATDTAVALNTDKVTNVVHPLVEAAVPSNAVFTDTVYSHPANHAISVITGLQTALDAKLTPTGSGAALTGITVNNDDWVGTDLAIDNGGTGASSASAARNNLGVEIGVDVLSPTGNGSGLTNIDAVPTGTTLPSPAHAAASLFYTTGDNRFYISDGSAWTLVANQGPNPTGGTVVIASVGESSGSYSYNLGIDFEDDVNTDAELTYNLESGTLPTGCVMPTTGNTAFTGSVGLVSGDTLFSFQIKATDVSGATNTQNYQQTITNTVPSVTGGTVAIAGVVESAAMSYDVDTDFTFGTNAVFSAYSLQSGTLPSGTSLDTATGVISGTAGNVSSNTTYTFTIGATDTDGDTVDQQYTWVISTLAPTTTGGTVTIPVVDETSTANYDVDTDFTFTTGSTFSAYSLQSGSLPSGLSLNTSTGVISGTMSAEATYTFTIRATDTDGDTADQGYSWATGPAPMTATGGTITNIAGYRVHTFTSSGIFTPNKLGTVEVLIVGGGGGGGGSMGGGGGGGAVYHRTAYQISAGSYGIVIGAGGAGGTGVASSGGTGSVGSATTAFSVSGAGGGGGGAYSNIVSTAGSNGGGGGSTSGSGGVGNLTAYSGWTGHGGNDGGSGAGHRGGGGGGAGSVGTNASNVPHGGVGHQININGTNLYWAGGGGGSDYNLGIGGDGGNGGGGGGADRTDGNGGSGGSGFNPGVSVTTGAGGNAGANTGGGGGGCEYNVSLGGNGGSGIVIVRYVA